MNAMSGCASSIKKLRLFDKDDANNDEDSNTSSQSSYVSQDTNLSDITSLPNTPVHVDRILLANDSSTVNISYCITLILSVSFPLTSIL